MIYPFKTIEQLKAAPFTELEMAHFNPKKRKVFCQYCKYAIETNLYGAKCGQCRSFLIEFVKSHFSDGKLAE